MKEHKITLVMNLDELYALRQAIDFSVQNVQPWSDSMAHYQYIFKMNLQNVKRQIDSLVDSKILEDIELVWQDASKE